MNDEPDAERREAQHAQVTMDVALPVDKEASIEEREKAILRAVRLSDMSEGLEIRGGLVSECITLSGTETMEERARRLEGQAESTYERKMEKQIERAKEKELAMHHRLKTYDYDWIPDEVLD